MHWSVHGCRYVKIIRLRYTIVKDMINKLIFISFLLGALLPVMSCSASDAPAQTRNKENVVVAYVTSWSDVTPDPTAMTHINYAFGHVGEPFDNVGIANPSRLAEIAALKGANPNLKVLLSIGGWGSGRFSEMAADDSLRTAFAADCRRVVDEYGIDGIDIDWEYPGSSAAGISSSPDDKDNFTLLMRDIRQAIGADRLLTLATAASANHIDYRAILPYIDFVNIMSYDMATPPYHHSPLYSGGVSGELTTDLAVKKHIAAGVPPSMLVVGIPFYGRGAEPYGNFCDFRSIDIPEGYTEQWDSTAMAPYIADSDGKLVLGFDNQRSIAAKCEYILNKGLRGAMYWDYAGDDDKGTLRKTVADAVLGRNNMPRVLVLSEGAGQHEPFTREAIKWLNAEGADQGFAMTEINRADPVSDRFLNDYACVIQLDYPPYTWPDYSQNAFVDYIDNGLGSWIGFHHATLLGDFDGYPMWDWFSDFMGGIRFNNYIAPLADGEVVVEDKTHPVMAGVTPKFIVEDDEWYTYDKSPRPNVRVLASVDESTYTPPSEIKMGDHPVIWTNPDKKARNVYFQIGHSPRLFGNPMFKKLFANAIVWAIGARE